VDPIIIHNIANKIKFDSNMMAAITNSINGMLNFDSGTIYKIFKFIFICWIISDSTVQRVTAIAAAIYTQVGMP
jgi:hypothetical protein